MSGKKYLGLAMIIIASLALSGCGEKFPDLTEEEYAQTVEYAVGLLMKYSNNGESKLTYVDPVIAQETIEQNNKKKEEEMHEDPFDLGPAPIDDPDEASSFSSDEDNADASMSGASDENGEGAEASEGDDAGKGDEGPDSESKDA